MYSTVTDSFTDHGQALSTMDRYRTAMQYTGSPDRFAEELQRAGYATSPSYAQDLIMLMRNYNLYQYDANLA
jgi:flagellar protein FlgJ